MPPRTAPGNRHHTSRDSTEGRERKARRRAHAPALTHTATPRSGRACSRRERTSARAIGQAVRAFEVSGPAGVWAEAKIWELAPIVQHASGEGDFEVHVVCFHVCDGKRVR